MKKKLLLLLLLAAAVFFGLRYYLAGKYVIPVLMYHSIAPAIPGRDYLNTVSPGSFEKQMQFIKNHGYQVLTVDDYVAIVRQGKQAPSHSVLITFDDGFLNNYTDAYPVLKKYNFPAVIFVPSGMVGKTGPDGKLPQMNAGHLRELSANGIVIGSHTASHHYLPELSIVDARQEIVDSKKELEMILGKPVLYFAYASGGFDEEIKAMVREAGYQAAFTTNRGLNGFNSDLFELKRIRPKDSDSAIVLWAKLSGYYNLFRDLKKGH